MTHSTADRAAAIIVAHYHPRGALRDDLTALLGALTRVGRRVLLVSTNLDRAAAARLDAGVEPIVRDNVGYDFYSHRIGIDALGELGSFSRLVLLNSSFVCVDPDRMLRGLFAAAADGVDAFGLTYSREHRRHLQSFALSFGPACLRSPAFLDWWRSMTPLDDRQQVITRYELGLSSFLRRSGFRLGHAYHPTLAECRAALARAWHTRQRTLNPYKLSPMHFYWDFVLRDYGIAKIEMVARDPYGLMDAATRERLGAACGAAGAA